MEKIPVVNNAGFDAEEADSPYVFREGASLLFEGGETGSGPAMDVVSLRKSGRLGRGIRVMDALYKYPYLDRCSLVACLRERGKTCAIEDRQLGDLIRFLIQAGLVVKITYGDFCFYALSDGARNQLEGIKKYCVHVPDFLDVPRILEAAALCRWHAHVTAEGDVGVNVVGQKMRFAGEDVIADSYLELKRSVRYRIFAFSSPRGSDANAFFEKLAKFRERQQKSARKGQVTITLVVTSSLSEMEAIDRTFGSMEDFRGKRLHYALDARRGRDAYGFRGFYYFENDGEGSSFLKSVNID